MVSWWCPNTEYLTETPLYIRVRIEFDKNFIKDNQLRSRHLLSEGGTVSKLLKISRSIKFKGPLTALRKMWPKYVRDLFVCVPYGNREK